MLTIRPEQMAVFADAATDAFVRNTAAGLQAILPRHCAALGPDGVREAVEFGIKQAARFQIVSEAGVTIYIRLMFMFGREFDRKWDWARSVLEAPAGRPSDSLAVQLAAAAEQFLKEAALVRSR